MNFIPPNNASRIAGWSAFHSEKKKKAIAGTKHALGGGNAGA